MFYQFLKQIQVTHILSTHQIYIYICITLLDMDIYLWVNTTSFAGSCLELDAVAMQLAWFNNVQTILLKPCLLEEHALPISPLLGGKKRGLSMTP